MNLLGAKKATIRLLFLFVPRAGVEPARTCVHWCLRPARLPIPPPGLLNFAMQIYIFEIRLQKNISFISG